VTPTLLKGRNVDKAKSSPSLCQSACPKADVPAQGENRSFWVSPRRRCKPAASSSAAFLPGDHTCSDEGLRFQGKPRQAGFGLKRKTSSGPSDPSRFTGWCDGSRCVRFAARSWTTSLSSPSAERKPKPRTLVRGQRLNSDDVVHGGDVFDNVPNDDEKPALSLRYKELEKPPPRVRRGLFRCGGGGD